MKKQNNKCGICKTPLTEMTRKIDHDHKTGIIRGLLCNACNWGLGHFKDNTKFLFNAVTYLKQ